MKINIFWFRRDLRLRDNAGLFNALKSANPVLPIFIFDTEILSKLEDKYDRRVEFIFNSLDEINTELLKAGSKLLILYGKPLNVFKELTEKLKIEEVFANNDYEPYALKRDEEIKKFLRSKSIKFTSFKDQVIFEKDEIVKADGKPYTVFTPYSKLWKSKLVPGSYKKYNTEKYFGNYLKVDLIPLNIKNQINTIEQTGFKKTGAEFPSKSLRIDIIKNYHKARDIPSIKGTSRLSVHLRFGTISIRELVSKALGLNETWLNELIWREFFMMILYNFPGVVNSSFKPAYDRIKWRNNEDEFAAWCNGSTGYPIVDAGMRELISTGFMHNRVRMITASFLCKHLLIDWRWGEAYFASKLLDYELASNNGNWQWAAGCGCDATPYFRVFSPGLQSKKFDPKNVYIKKWVPEFESSEYIKPFIEHREARERALKTYREALKYIKA